MRGPIDGRFCPTAIERIRHMAKPKYKVVMGNEIAGLSALNALLDEGWEPYGPMTVLGKHWFKTLCYLSEPTDAEAEGPTPTMIAAAGPNPEYEEAMVVSEHQLKNAEYLRNALANWLNGEPMICKPPVDPADDDLFYRVYSSDGKMIQNLHDDGHGRDAVVGRALTLCQHHADHIREFSAGGVLEATFYVQTLEWVEDNI